MIVLMVCPKQMVGYEVVFRLSFRSGGVNAILEAVVAVPYVW